MRRPSPALAVLDVGFTKHPDLPAPRVRAFEWLLREGPGFGVRVLLCPFGDDPERPGAPSPVPGLVRELSEAGMVALAAAGWDLEAHCVSPASSPHAIGVGGWDLDHEAPAAGPQFERVRGVPKPDLLSPSTPLVVPALDGGQASETAGGTSFAASLVAGAVIRLLSGEPDLTRSGVLARLKGEAREVPGHPPYLDPAGLRRVAGEVS
jgi:hypothetical protein